MVICKFLQVNPATNATSEGALSMARRVIWLRANIMNQKTFYHVAILQKSKIVNQFCCYVNVKKFTWKKQPL